MILCLVPMSINDYLVLSFGDHHLSRVINFVPRKQQSIVDPMDRIHVRLDLYLFFFFFYIFYGTFLFLYFYMTYDSRKY
jgi:hypothetical protein